MTALPLLWLPAWTPAWINDALHNQMLGMGLLAGGIGALWALGEIIGEFRAETGRALRTWGAWLLIVVNFIAAALIFVFAVSLVPTTRGWASAVLIGFAWPTVFRNVSLKLTQPLNDAPENEATAVRVEKLYAAIQRLALQLINSVLTRQRINLMSTALHQDLPALETFARRMIAFSPQVVDPAIVDQVLARQTTDEVKKAYLAALVMNTFTRSALEDFIKENKRG